MLCWSIGWFGLLVFGYLFGIVAEQFADDVDDASDPPAVTDSPHAPQPPTPPQTPPGCILNKQLQLPCEVEQTKTGITHVTRETTRPIATGSRGIQTMTTDNRTEDQKVAAVRASMTMAGHTISFEQEARLRRVLRGEITGDEAALEVIESYGYGDSERAEILRQRIAKAKDAQ